MMLMGRGRSYTEAEKQAYVDKEKERRARRKATFEAWMDAHRAEMADPATPTRQLGELWNQAVDLCDDVDVSMTEAEAIMATNPSAPAPLLLWCASSWANSPFHAVWFNPVLPLLMLRNPDRAWTAHAVMCLGGILHGDTTEEWRKTLVTRCRCVLYLEPELATPEQQKLARQFVTLFGLELTT